MIASRITGPMLIVAILVAAQWLPGHGIAGETITFDAFSVWQAKGRIVRTGAQTGTVLGIIRGPIYVETERGPVGTGDMVCPFSIEVDLETSRQQGSGSCTINTKDDLLLYSRFTCSGYHLVGCTGDFELTGGTGKFDGVTGTGKITFRSDKWELAKGGQNEALEGVTGIAFWRDLTLQLP